MAKIECYLKLEDGSVAYVRHNAVKPDNPTVLFVHGLGESGQCYSEAFELLRESNFNLVVPDLAGYGRSSAATDYSFDAHCARLCDVIEQLERSFSFPIDELNLVGHSMGGDIATLLSHGEARRQIKSLVNVEGDLTKSDVFISQGAVRSGRDGAFPRWLKHFRESTVLREWGCKYPECSRYYGSLLFAREEAFLANATEIVQRNSTHLSAGGSEIGEMYRALGIPKCYCFGTESVSRETFEYLQCSGLEHIAFQGSFHWVMTARPVEFYSFLCKFLLSHNRS